ncbi:BEACH domain-containing protein B isoform X1 [Tanacetum coccineum]
MAIVGASIHRLVGIITNVGRNQLRCELAYGSPPHGFPVPTQKFIQRIMKCLKFQAEKQKAFHVFLKQFLVIFKNWEPFDIDHSSEAAASSAVSYGDDSQNPDEVVIGCSAAHPAEIIVVLIEEVTHITSMVTESAVVQLKTIAGALSADETLSSSNVGKAGFLQKILVRVISIVCGFINLRVDVYGKVLIDIDNLEFSVERIATTPEPFQDLRDPLSEKRVQWHQKAVISVMEAGGLNWLVELLRVVRRLSLKEQWTDLSLQYLTLRTLQLALTDNPRGQNHFRSIGGLEVLLDYLGASSVNSLRSRNSSSDNGSDGNHLKWILQLHLLSLEVLREAVEGKTNIQNTGITETSSSVNTPSCQYWSNYTVSLSKAFYSFVLTLEDLRSHQVQSSSRHTYPFSSVYGELSIKFIVRVLLTVFPSIKTFSDQTELPTHLRIFLYSLQHYMLFVFRKILVLSPSLLNVYRSEGAWDFIFSEHFYFGSSSTVIPEAYINYSDVRPWSNEPYTRSKSFNKQVPSNEADILQTNVISVIEFAATLDVISHNMQPECSVLISSLELFACNPDVATGLAKCLLHILQLAPEKTVSSFNTLDAIPRVLKVACVQAQESKRPFIPSSEDDRKAKLYLCSKYLETFTHVKEREENFAKLSVDLLVGMRDMLVKDRMNQIKGLLTALLDMLVDGKFDLKKSPIMRSSDSMRNEGLNIFLHLLRDSISNRASCVRVGMLSFLLDWFPCEDNESVVLKIGQLIQVTGGHSVSGKEIRKIFALLRSEKVGMRQQYCSLLLTNISSMLNEKGPTAFFNFDGYDSAVYQKRQCVSLPLSLVGKRWHFLCITHSIGRAFSGGSHLKCYLDGVLVSSEKCSFMMPKMVLLQASNRRTLFNVSPLLDHALDKSPFEATVKSGPTHDTVNNVDTICLQPITKERLTAEIIELIASVLDENLPNQQQMLNLSGFSVLGFLLQSVPSQQLNMETLSALKHMLNSLAEVLLRISNLTVFQSFTSGISCYTVQRELYMFLIQQFDNDPRLLLRILMSAFPRILDHNSPIFNWDNMASHSKEHIAVSDIESLVSFLETSQDMACIEDILHMIIRALSQKSLLVSFLDQVNLELVAVIIFINIASNLQSGAPFYDVAMKGTMNQSDCLACIFLGRLFVAMHLEKKGSSFFTLAIGRSKSHLEGPKRVESKLQPIYSAMSDRLFRFPQTDVLCATFFDVLLGGASPKQALLSRSTLVTVMQFLSDCEDVNARIKIMGDLLELLDSNVSNIEAFMENGWNGWLVASSKLDVLKTYKMPSQAHNDRDLVEQGHARNLFSVVLCHYVQSVKGGWQHLEETVNFLLIKGGKSYQYLLHDIYEDLITRLVDLSSKENILSLQPCRDNTFYLLKLIDEMLISELDNKLPVCCYPSCPSIN